MKRTTTKVCWRADILSEGIIVMVGGKNDLIVTGKFRRAFNANISLRRALELGDGDSAVGN